VNLGPAPLNAIRKEVQATPQSSNGRTIWIADAHRGDGKRFVVHAEEKLTAFVELELAIRAGQEDGFLGKACFASVVEYD